MFSKETKIVKIILNYSNYYKVCSFVLKMKRLEYSGEKPEREKVLTDIEGIGCGKRVVNLHILKRMGSLI